MSGSARLYKGRSQLDLEKTQELVFRAIDELNELQPEDQQVETTPNTVLFGDESVLTSLALVNLVAAVEERVEDETGASISIIAEGTFDEHPERLRTLGALIEYVAERIQKA